MTDQTAVPVDKHACGTCLHLAAAGKPLEHQSCHARARLIPAPDSNWEEWPDGLEARQVLPARFHIPQYVEDASPPYWCCAACWDAEEGITMSWPCHVAIAYGAEVFSRD